MCTSKVNASMTDILFMPTIYTTVPFITEMYLDALSFVVKLWTSAYFFVSSNNDCTSAKHHKALHKVSIFFWILALYNLPMCNIYG